jgi:hypothetical protein
MRRLRTLKRSSLALTVLLIASAIIGPGAMAKDILVCAPDTMAADCAYSDIAQAAAAAEAGDAIVLRPGIYREGAVLTTDRLTLRAEPGAQLVGAAVKGKGALVIQGNDVIVEGLQCSEVAVPDGNGACVRAEGVNLTLRRVHFHDSQQGLLGGRGRVVIEDSVFERLGGDREKGLGYAHGIYIGHLVDEFILRRSQVLASREEGHEVKSRAVRTIIEDNVIASLNGVDSRQIDIPNAGDIVIRRNVIEKGPRSSNPQFIAIGLERGRKPEWDNGRSTEAARIEGNIFVNDHRRFATLVKVDNAAPAALANNIVIGSRPEDLDEFEWYPTRRKAGLGPFPDLPAVPAP